MLERIYGFHPVREALRARRRKIFRLAIREGRLSAEDGELVALAEAAGVALERPPARELDRMLPGGVRSQGVVLEAGPVPLVPLDALTSPVVALDGVEDPQNLGAIFRVAEAAGCGGLLLTTRRAPPLSPAVARASAGALEHLPVARVTNLSRTLESLRKRGFWSVGADSSEGQDLFAAPDRLFEGELVVVLGAEGRGIRPGLRGCLDHRIRIPMQGQLASLNVASAGAVLLFEALRRRRQFPS